VISYPQGQPVQVTPQGQPAQVPPQGQPVQVPPQGLPTIAVQNKVQLPAPKINKKKGNSRNCRTST